MHIFRIEDIVVNSLILNRKEVLKKYEKKIGSSIITTGNELVGKDIVDFSKNLNIDILYSYALDVKNSTDEFLNILKYQNLNKSFTDVDKERLINLEVVSTNENAFWLIDYWCGKNIRGLIQMPLSRHWIMHTEASLRIKNKI